MSEVAKVLHDTAIFMVDKCNSSHLDDRDRFTVLNNACLLETCSAKHTFDEPSRSILFQSAATMAMWIKDYRRASLLCKMALQRCDPDSSLYEEIHDLGLDADHRHQKRLREFKNRKD